MDTWMNQFVLGRGARLLAGLVAARDRALEAAQAGIGERPRAGSSP
jgi:hypothetical protein